MVALLSLCGLVEVHFVNKSAKEKPRVLCYGRFFDETPGGIQTHTLHLMRALSKEVDFVHAVTSRDRTGSAIRAGKRIPVIRTPSWNVDGSLAISPGLVMQTRRLHNKKTFDLVHLHFPDPMSHLASMVLPASVPRVISWHADIVRHKNMLFFYLPLLKRAVRKALAVIVATPAHISSSPVLSDLKPSRVIHVVPFGFDFSEFTNPSVEQADIGKKYSGRRIFATGRHVAYKGFDVLLRAMSLLPTDVVLLLGGDGPMTAYLKEMVETAGLQSRVHFLGFVPQKKLPVYFHACDVFCLPSVTSAEAFGIVQVEAMACGKPVVSTRLNNGVDFVNEDGKTGRTVPPGDPVALAEALLEVLDDNSKASQWGAAGKSKAFSEYSSDKMAERIFQIYRTAINKSK